MGTIEITDVSTLAAVDRVVRHRATGVPGAAPVWVLCAHLGISTRSGAARRLRARLAALDGSGLARGTRLGVQTWALTAAGKRRLDRLRLKGELPVLPESPQHRAWREAHAQAEQRIAEFWRAVLDAVEHACWLLEAPAPGAPVLDLAGAVPGPRSDEWFEVGEQLQHACRRLASPTAERSPDITQQTVDHSLESSRSLDPAQNRQPKTEQALEPQHEREQEQDHDRDIDLGFGID